MAPLTCGCDKGVTLCATAARLWRSYLATCEVSEALQTAYVMGIGDNDPLQYDRRRLAHEAVRSCRVRYERHVDGYDEPAPEPQSLKAPLRIVGEVGPERIA